MIKRMYYGGVLAGVSALLLFGFVAVAAPETEQNIDTEQITESEQNIESETHNNRLRYLKNNTVYWFDPDSGTSHEITTVNNPDDVDGSSYRIDTMTPMTRAESVLYSIEFSPEQRYLCGFQQIESFRNGNNLMVWDTHQTAIVPEPIDQEVLGSINLSAEAILYIKINSETREREYIYYNLVSRERISIPFAISSESYMGYILKISENGKQIIWSEFERFSSDEDVYYMNLDDLAAGKRLLFSGYDRIEYISDDLQTIYYVVEGKDLEPHEISWRHRTMYCIKNLSNKYEVAHDYYYFDVIEESGNAYWERIGEQVSVIDFIDDDMATADAAIKMPQAGKLSEEQYQTEMQKYQEKLGRDELRSDIGVAFGADKDSLFYFNGRESIKVTDDLMRYTMIGENIDAVNAIITPPFGSIRMSDLKDPENAFSEARDLLAQRLQAAFITEGKCFVLPVEAAGNLVDWDGVGIDLTDQLVYFLDPNRTDVKGNETLMAASFDISAGLGTPYDVDTGVVYLGVLEGKVFYGKEPSEDYELFSLYRKGEQIADSVFDLRYQDGILYYLRKGAPAYALYRYDGERNDRIMTGAHWFLPLDHQRVAVLKDSRTEGQGDLYLWSANDGLSLIANEVKAVSPIMTTEMVAKDGWKK